MKLVLGDKKVGGCHDRYQVAASEVSYVRVVYILPLNSS
jgi:hypothetical protein